MNKLAAAFYEKSHGLADYSQKGELLDDLVRAIEDRRLTVLTYQSLNSTEPVTHYDVHPYAVIWHNRALYLIAYSCDHEAIRTFKLDRISAAKVEGLPFNRPADFSPEQFLAGSLGIFQGDGEPQTVRVRFSGKVARAVAERTHHPSQKLTHQPDGSLLAEFQLSSFEELTSWLLSYGEHVEVLEPKELRERVIATLQVNLRLYEKQPQKLEPSVRSAKRK